MRTHRNDSGPTTSSHRSGDRAASVSAQPRERGAHGGGAGREVRLRRSSSTRQFGLASRSRGAPLERRRQVARLRRRQPGPEQQLVVPGASSAARGRARPPRRGALRRAARRPRPRARRRAARSSSRRSSSSGSAVVLDAQVDGARATARPSAGTTTQRRRLAPAHVAALAPRRPRSAASSRSASGPSARLEGARHRRPDPVSRPSCSPGAVAARRSVAGVRRCSARRCAPRRAPRASTTADLAHAAQLVGGEQRAERLAGASRRRRAGRARSGRRRARRPTASRPRRRPARAHAHERADGEPVRLHRDAELAGRAGRGRRSSRSRGASRRSVAWLTPCAVQRRPSACSSASARSREGFVRAYGDVSPGAPRFAGTVLHAADDPDRARGTASCAPTARWRRARASARCSRPRACRSAATGVDMRVARLPRRCGSSVRSPSRPRPRGFHLVTARGARRAAGAARAARRALHLLHPPHVGVADAQRERLARRAARLRDVVRRTPCPRTSPCWTHTLEGPDDMPAHIKASLLGPSLSLPVSRRPPRARHVAGHLPLRAPRPRRRRARCSPRSGASDAPARTRRSSPPTACRRRTASCSRRCRAGARVLDVGCATGYLAAELAARGSAVVGRRGRPGRGRRGAPRTASASSPATSRTRRAAASSRRSRRSTRSCAPTCSSTSATRGPRWASSRAAPARRPRGAQRAEHRPLDRAPRAAPGAVPVRGPRPVRPHPPALLHPRERPRARRGGRAARARRALRARPAAAPGAPARAAPPRGPAPRARGRSCSPFRSCSRARPAPEAPAVSAPSTPGRASR